ncbi:large conductance mechanosensitive channel protein MscL [Candidatus Saccharibacteria bacterium]|nr:large conductance mechanosensitive channel protein MscL [Candidatus Saccharibacteria bacterium]
MFNEFKKFILRGNVVDLAVGVIIGAAFNSVVQSLVAMITEFLPSKNGKFATASVEVLGKKLLYGQFINALISFIIVAAVVFFLVVKPINKLNEITMGKKDTEDPETKKCPYCYSVIATKATRCRFCTSKLELKESKQSAS